MVASFETKARSNFGCLRLGVRTGADVGERVAPQRGVVVAHLHRLLPQQTHFLHHSEKAALRTVIIGGGHEKQWNRT